jgi:hypothetical protein
MTDENFHHSKLTTAHTPPNMVTTYTALLAYMKKNGTHVFQPGRATEYTIKDFLDEGLSALHKGKKADDGAGGGDEDGDDETNEQVDYSPDRDLEPDGVDLSIDV